ncbi:MAG: penicillin-binding protein 2 [Proteobacteria bacterium]|nr:penicillin-binding protein 2 [Pseudomonadota bacterium]
MSMKQRDQQRDQVFTRRALLLGGAKLGLFSALVGRLYYLQVVEAERYKVLAEDNRINLKLLAPPRGRILDRFGEPLALNRLNYRVVIVAEQARDVEHTLDQLAQLIEVTDADRRRVMRDVRKKRAFVPVTVRENLNWDDVSKIEINAPDLPGVSIDVGQSRFYPHTEAVGHILGYVGAVSETELTGEPLLELPEFRIGKNGMEKTRDLDLRGAAGASQVEVNAVGRVIRELNRQDAIPGKDVELTLDIGLQEFTRQRIGDESAAAVVMDIHTGEVLAMVSAPAFDPNLFSHGLNARDWEEFLANPKQPLNNKAIQGQYPPGSTFKMMTALAALDAGVITPATIVNCPGHYALGDRQWYCWKYKGGHGSVDLAFAIKQSCDCFFYETAKRVGIDKLAAMAKRFGMGARLGLDIPGERPGNIPTRDWMLATRGHPWTQGETLNAGIGQGMVLVTPLQLAVMTARIANGGYAVVPHLTRAVGGKPAENVKQPAFPSLGVNPAVMSHVFNGMVAVCNDPRGTAFRSRIAEPGLEMAGKTGSAQVRRVSAAERDHDVRRKDAEIPWRERDHALFISFAPIQAPRYACAVVVEHGLHGSDTAAPIARDVLLEAQKRDLGRQPPGRIAGEPKAAG